MIRGKYAFEYTKMHVNEEGRIDAYEQDRNHMNKAVCI